jgi:hypothetical protein
MIWLKVAIGIFMVLEIGNIAILYFMPDTKLANAMGYFKAWEKSKRDSDVHALAKYLVNWVAGTKLIFIMLLGILLFTGDQKVLVITAAAMIVSISSFYWRLFPAIRKMDQNGEIDPENYSITLGWMITGMIVLFGLAIIFSFLL